MGKEQKLWNRMFGPKAKVKKEAQTLDQHCKHIFRGVCQITGKKATPKCNCSLR